ncbi:MAG: prepilin-type N-terminal cleavage/methylation domain-containing protein [Myxococcota bacterium]
MDVRQQGFSLAELMVVVVLLGVLVAGVMSSFTTQKKSVSVNSQIVDAQQSARLLGDLLEEDIRHAGLLVPESAALCGVDNTNAPDVLFVSDAAAIRPDDEINTSLGARIGGGSGLVGGNNVRAASSRSTRSSSSRRRPIRPTTRMPMAPPTATSGSVRA